MYSRLVIDLLNFAFVCVSALRHPFMSSKVTTTLPSILGGLASRSSFFDRKFTVRTIHHVFTFSWKAMKVSVASLEESSAVS